MPSLYELLIILLIVALLFGTKKLRSMGGDLGSAVKSFRSAIKEEEEGTDAVPDAAAMTSSEASVPESKDKK